MKRHAIIVGAGIAGAAAGVAFGKAGWSVELYDRAAGVPSAGTALGMWAEAMRALDAIDIGDHIRDIGIRQSEGTILDPTGKVIARIDTGDGAYLVSRPVLLDALQANLSPGSVRWNSRVTCWEDLPAADVVVAADGINSCLRDRVVGRRAAPRPLGTVAFRGTVPILPADVSETWGPGRLFGITPNTAQTTNWFAAVRQSLLPAQLHPADNPGLLRALFGSWHPAVGSVLDELTSSSIDMHTLQELPRLPRYTSGATALIGDAAHAMAPNLGRGACESIVDAVALADALASTNDIEQGLRRYDNQRRGPSQRIAAASRAMNRISTTRRLAPVRNALARGAGSVTALMRPGDRGPAA